MSGPYDQGGYGNQQYNQGYNQGGYSQGQHDQSGYNQGAYNQGGYDQSSYQQGGHNQNPYPPQQGHSPYPQDHSGYSAPPAPTYGGDQQPNQHSQSYGPPQQGGFQHGQMQAPSYGGEYPQQQSYGQYPASNTQQYPQQGPYSQSPAPGQYGGSSDPAVQQEGDRGLMGAVAGGIGGHMFGKKHNHGIVGTLAGAFLGSKAEDMLKGKNKHNGQHGGQGRCSIVPRNSDVTSAPIHAEVHGPEADACQAFDLSGLEQRCDTDMFSGIRRSLSSFLWRPQIIVPKHRERIGSLRQQSQSTMAQSELKARKRSDYGFTLEYRTRWSDNDMYDHMNNSIYYFLFDSVVNTYLITHCNLHPPTSPYIGLVVHSHCDYFAPVAFPAVVDLCLRVKKLGHSSVTHEIGVFERGVDEVKAVGEFVHVFVDSKERKPRKEGMGDALRQGLGKLAVREGSKL